MFLHIKKIYIVAFNVEGTSDGLSNTWVTTLERGAGVRNGLYLLHYQLK